MASFLGGGKFKEFLKKYGKVAMGVHLSVSAASIAGLYVAINNNVDVESILGKIGISSPASPPPDPNGGDLPTQKITTPPGEDFGDGVLAESGRDDLGFEKVEVKNTRNRTAEMAGASGGALALAVLCNKALFPIRVPITIALTPPVARFLRTRGLIKSL